MIMRKRIQHVVCMTLCLFLWLLPVQAITLKIATLSPDGSMWMEKMRHGADEVAKLTENRVTFKYYPGGVMGDDKAMIRKIRIGQLHGGAVVSGSMTQFYPDCQIYGIPMMFRSYGEVDYVRERMDPTVRQGLEDNGFVVLGMAEGGFGYIMSNQAIKNVEDLGSAKVWAPDNDPAILDAVNAFDVSPIPLSMAEVRAGLQTGLIDTITCPPYGAIVLQWHTQIKYVTDIPIFYIYAMLVVDQKSFNKIAAADQKIIREVMERTYRDIEKDNRANNNDAMDVLKKQGIEFVEPTDDGLAKWRKTAAKVPANLLASGRLSKELFEQLNRYLEAYRAEHPK